jgi:hypothetical protein
MSTARDTHASRMLTAIEAALEGRITSDMEQYSIAGRQITKIPVNELLVLRDKYKAEVQAEEDAENLKLGYKSKRIIKTRF